MGIYESLSLNNVKADPTKSASSETRRYFGDKDVGPGKFTAKIRNFVVKFTQEKKVMFALECVVTASNNSAIKVGEARNIMRMAGDKFLKENKATGQMYDPYFMEALKNVITAASGCAADHPRASSEDWNMLALAASDKKLVEGDLIEIECKYLPKKFQDGSPRPRNMAVKEADDKNLVFATICTPHKDTEKKFLAAVATDEKSAK